MARLIPSLEPKWTSAIPKTAELETLELLHRELSDNYAVFHSVHWTRIDDHNKLHFGEVDFIIVNQAGRVVLVEQKNGPLTETDYGLVKRYPDKDKRVMSQVGRSIDGILDKFAALHPRDAKLHIDYIIYCPDHRIRHPNGAAIDIARIVHAGSSDTLNGRISSLLPPGVRGANELRERVVDFFRQSFDLVPDIHQYAQSHETNFVRISGGLLEVIDNLEMIPYRLRVDATAGSGKSHLARHYFTQCVIKGQRPLAVCFNRPLAERVKSHVPEGGYVNTFYGLCAEFLESIGERLDYARLSEGTGFWQEVQDRVMLANIRDTWLFDSLIIDEGQDFDEEWLEIAKLFLREDGDILFLEDRDQNLLGKSRLELQHFVTFRAPWNYRTPASIAEFIKRALPFHVEYRNQLPGLGVGVQTYQLEDEQPALVSKRVARLRQQGIEPEDIIILSAKGLTSTCFNTVDKLNELDVRRFTGRYDVNGNQEFTSGRLRIESVFRFKGQEAQAVVLVDVDPRASHETLWWRRLFCAMTRATLRLDLIIKADNPLNERFISAMD